MQLSGSETRLGLQDELIKLSNLNHEISRLERLLVIAGPLKTFRLKCVLGKLRAEVRVLFEAVRAEVPDVSLR